MRSIDSVGILCHVPEKGRKDIEQIVEEMKERNREERGTGMKAKKQKKQKHSPSTLTCYKDSRPCPTVSQYQFDTPVTSSHHPTTPSNEVKATRNGYHADKIMMLILKMR